jgi:hypothetical protein
MKNINPAASYKHATELFKEINAMFDPDFHYCRPLYFSTARQDPYDKEIQQDVRMVITAYYL